MRALLDKSRHNGSPVKPFPDTDLDLFHFFCVAHSYFSAASARRAVRLSKAFPLLVRTQVSMGVPSTPGVTAAPAETGLPFLGLPFPCSSQGRTPFTLTSDTSPPLPLETLPQRVGLLVSFS